MNRYLIAVFFLIAFGHYGRGSEDTDSLKAVLSSADITRQDRLSTYADLLSAVRLNPDSVLKYGRIMLELCDENDIRLSAIANLYIGQALKAKGSYEQSVDHLFQSMQQKKQIGERVTVLEGLLGSVYGRIGDMEKSSMYFHRALEADEEDWYLTLNFANNFGEAFYQNDFYDSAYYYFSKARKLAKEANSSYFYKFFQGNLGMVNLELGNLDSAEVQLKEVIALLENSADIRQAFQIFLARVYHEKNQLDKAIDIVNQVIDEATLSDYKEQIRDGYELLSELLEEKGNYKGSLEAYRRYVEAENNIKDIETVRRIGDMQTEFEVGQKQVEVDLLTAEKRNQQLIILGVGLLALVFIILAIIIYRFYQSKAKINAQLERLNQTKDKFFSIISHDLRGPVSSFMGISRMIKFLVESKETDQLLEVADDIDESVDRLSALLDNLLNWAMQQQGHFPNIPEKVNLEELSEDLVRTLNTMAKGKQITLEHSVSSEINLWADRNTTMTILRNLVNNALKFTPEGGRVSIDAYQSNGVAQIKVSDTGVGIPKEKLKKLFQLEDKKSTYGTSGEKGLGLGLQLVYEFVEMNQGSLNVESEEGKGTTFTIMLPTYEMENVSVKENTIK